MMFVNLCFGCPSIDLLVPRRRLSAEWGTIVFSPVRPSARLAVRPGDQKIWSKTRFKRFWVCFGCFWKFWFLSVCPSVHVSTLLSITLYDLYLRNPSTDLIFLLHMERTYIGAVQQKINFYVFFRKLKKWEFFEKCIYEYVRPVYP